MEDQEENLVMGNTGRALAQEELARLARISRRLTENPRAFLDHLDDVAARAESHNIPPPVPHKVGIPTISPEVIASIAATVMATVRSENPIPATLASTSRKSDK